ncbi:MAG: nucleotidyltransferase domain-containing protein [Candidatus Methylomirabilales bacterium]
MRQPKDRDFVETKEGFFLCLVGYLHPPDRYMAYLKYTPADVGKWARGDVFYRRELPYYHVRNVLKTLEFLEQHHPQYVWFDPTRNLTFSFVPKEAVVTYYIPEERLAEIVADPRDPLEREVKALVELFTKEAGVPQEAFGITGSVLLKLHNPAFSDIDLLVYGKENAQKMKKAVETLKGGPIQPLPEDRQRQWRLEVAERFALLPEDVAYLEARRWNYFMFQGRYVSIHPIRRDEEITEEYGGHRSRSVGAATIEATVTDATESLFLPAVYRLTDVKVVEACPEPVEGGSPFKIQELHSFEGLFGQIADPGDRILARGVVEEVNGSYRLVVGSASLPDGSFIRKISQRSAKSPLL